MANCDYDTAYRKIPLVVVFDMEHCYYQKNDVECESWAAANGGTGSHDALHEILLSLDNG